MDLRERIEQVLSRIAAAAERAGRNPGGITLIAVTKVFPASAIREGYELGLRDFGENRDQEAAAKAAGAEAVVSGLTWHFIGQLQTNKARSVVFSASAFFDDALWSHCPFVDQFNCLHAALESGSVFDGIGMSRSVRQNRDQVVIAVLFARFLPTFHGFTSATIAATGPY